jgi:DNA-binding CsgD family transcriptional regulator
VRTVGDRLVEADALRVQGAPAPADRLREARRAYVTYLWSQERRITVDPSVAHALEVIGPPDRDLEAGAAGVSRANGLEPGISGVNGLEPGTSGVNGLESGASDVNGLESGVSGLNGLESGAPEVDGTSRRPSAVPEGRIPPAGTLTAREHEIALLVSQGLSNRAIAGELVISSATVARHVANILAKLGFSSRTQVAAWMVERRAHQAGGQS